MNEIIAIAMITVLAVISPGADFALVSRNSYLYGRQSGLYTAYGIACAVWIHIGYSVFGLSVLKHYLPDLLSVIQYVGALYLIHIGYKTFIQLPVVEQSAVSFVQRKQAFRQGFLTNSLNPKTTLFVMSIFAQLLSNQNQMLSLIGYGVFISASHLIWFMLVACFCSTPAIRNQILQQQKMINRLIGAILSCLGLGLLLI
ncbi:LysE family translocator [Acinetobacter tandoii]|nr:LysE family translocator [Acinetobacter tandoii]